MPESQHLVAWQFVFVGGQGRRRLYVLDTRLKRGLSRHYLVVRWIRWQGRMLDRPWVHKRIVRVDLERMAEAPVLEIFNSHLWQSFDIIPRETGDSESEWTMFSPSLLKLLHCAANTRRLVTVIMVTPGPDGGHQR